MVFSYLDGDSLRNVQRVKGGRKGKNIITKLPCLLHSQIVSKEHTIMQQVYQFNFVVLKNLSKLRFFSNFAPIFIARNEFRCEYL